MEAHTYIERNQATFEEMPFGPLDALAFTWLTYFDMSELEPRLPLPLSSLVGSDYESRLGALHQSFVPRVSAKLFRAMNRSKRYGNARIIANVEKHDDALSLQFGALAIQIDGLTILSFEGTDISFTGWREDCIMSYSDRIASYPLAMEWTKKILAMTEGPLILSGHSKGGNIACYVLSQLEDDSRIPAVYSFEGPGFHSPDIFAAHPERPAKIHKYIPQGSIVGVMLNSNVDATIVRSPSVGIFQHNALRWTVQDGAFVPVIKGNMTSRVVNNGVNAWVDELSEDEKKRLIGILFGAVKGKKLRVTKIVRDTLSVLPTLGQAYMFLDKEDRAFVNRVIKQLFKKMWNGAKKKKAN